MAPQSLAETVYCLKRETSGQVVGEFDSNHFSAQAALSVGNR